MFLRVLGAMLTADAIDRHARRRQSVRTIDLEARHQERTAVVATPRIEGRTRVRPVLAALESSCARAALVSTQLPRAPLRNRHGCAARALA